jgi:hypothetical protein
VKFSNPGVISTEFNPNFPGGHWGFKPDEARYKRYKNDNQPHLDTWP